MKKNGFTLIEIIAIIVLLGVISLIFVPSIREILKENRERVYSTYRKNMILASETYMIDNNIFVTSIENVVYIDLNNLINEDLISESDCDGYVKVEYDNSNGSVNIKKDAFLKCDDYITSGYEEK